MYNMKKFYLVLMAVAALSLATLSCSKEAMDPSQPEPAQKEETQKEESTPENPAEEEESPVPEGMIRLTFGVSQEGDAPAADGEDTKTSWDGTNHTWSEGDQIRIFWGTGAEDYVDATVENNKVEAVVGEADNYYAVYPITGAFAFREGGTIDFGIPILQSGSFKDANMMAATTSKATTTFNFKNLTHIFKFHLTNDSPYDRFQFCTNNGSIVVNTYGVSFDLEGNVTIGKRTQEISGFANSKYVRLHEGMTPGGDYYFAVVPGAQYSLGFGLQARISGETGDYSVAALSKRDIDTSNPRKITNLGNLDPYVHSDWFITADGTGNGTSWDDPGGPALLRSLLVMPSTFTTDQAKKNHTIRLNNAKIHLKEGTYNFQTILADTGQKAFQAGAFHTDVNNVTVIDGGYPSSATGKDLSGYDPVNHPSVVISNQAATNDRAFYFNGARLYDWTFKGLSFQNNPSGSNFNTPGGAMAINGATNANIKFEDCSFSLKTTNTSGGGAFSFRGSAEVNAEFKNCTFTSCESSSYGGAIWINTTNHNLTFDGCTMSGNTGSKGGGFLYNQNSGTVIIKNSTIENNSATSSTGLGGAIYASGSGTIHLYDTSLSGNGTDTQAQNGGIIWMGGTIELSIHSGSTVSNNKASSSGGAVLVAETASFKADDVLFSGNNAANGGAVYNSGTVTLTNCTLSANDCATNGGAIYNEGSLTLNETILTGKGKSTNLTTLLGGGIYNKSGATATIENSSVIEGCAITGSSHHGAAIWNGGTLIIDGSTLRNNVNTQRGGGIYCVGTAADATITNMLFDDNDADNGGAIAADDGAGIFINKCKFINSNAKNGAAIRTATNSGTDVNKILIFNSLFSNNTSTAGTNTQNGGIIQGTGYCSIVLANSTVCNNTTNEANSAVTTSKYNNADHAKLYVVSSTIADNTRDLTRTSTTIEVHNSIIKGLADHPLNVIIEKTFWYGHLYSEDRDHKTDDVEFYLGVFDPEKGVYPLVPSYSNVYKAGMTVEELQGMSFSNITTDLKALLAKDQKGNDRTGDTIMGAYVLTE